MDGGAPHPHGIRSGSRLGQSPGSNVLAGCESGQPALLLLFRTKRQDVVGTQAIVCRHTQTHRPADGSQLLNGCDVFEVPETGATVGLWHQHAQQTELAHPREGVPWKMLGLVPLHHMGLNLLGAEVAHHVPDGGNRLFLLEVHCVGIAL